MTNQILADPPLVHDNTLHVIGVISNTSRWHSRYRLFREWYKEMQNTANVEVYVVEAAFGDRSHEITFVDEHKHLQVRTSSEIWVKENLINLGVRHLLPRNWRYMAWIDCDVSFREPMWAIEAMQQAQHFPVLQPWQSAADLGPLGQITNSFSSFGYLFQAGFPIQTHPEQPYRYGHSGFAWVCRRDWWEAAHGLLDFAILGSADHHMAWACVGKGVENSVHAGMSDGFKRAVQDWQNKVVRITNKQVGFAPGRIEHSFHGPKKRRGYRERWQILIKYQFDPFTDLKYDHQGLIQLIDKPGLEHAIRLYNRSRFEDSIEE